jgi:hypothetical protein
MSILAVPNAGSIPCSFTLVNRIVLSGHGFSVLAEACDSCSPVGADIHSPLIQGSHGSLF